MIRIRIQIWNQALNGLYYVRDFVDFAVRNPLTYDEGLRLSERLSIMPPRNGRLSIEVLE